MVNIFGFFKRGKKSLKKAEPTPAEKLAQAQVTVRDLIAPSALDVSSSHLRLDNYFVKTIFVFAYPRFLYTNWLSSVINFDMMMDVGMYVYPVQTDEIMESLRRKVTVMQASWQIDQEKGLVRDPELQAGLEDAEELRDKLQRGDERFFHYALYFTIYAKSQDELNTKAKQVEAALAGNLIYTKQALFQMEQGFNTTLPLANDELLVFKNMTTDSIATSFPFVSMDMTSDDGILYGINRHNNSLVLFDRFNLENANMSVFAKSGAGKSYAVKLEVLRSLMFDTDVIVIDPENEYEKLTKTVGGTYLNVDLNSDKRVNPFDLPELQDSESTDEAEDNLRSAVITLVGLMGLMLGELTTEEEAIVDKALFEAYRLKDITGDPRSHKNPAPTMQDLYEVLKNMEGGKSLARRLEKFVTGTFAGIFNKPTNIDLNRGLVVFSIRDLEEQLRPIAMYIILNYIWGRIRRDKRKRVLVVDEAWTLMQYEDSARFMYSIAKRARKYYLGLTTITQDVEDFLGTKYGKAIVANSSLQLLMRQSPASIEIVTDTFNLTEGEKFILLEAEVGEGLFFVGNNHVAIKIVASYNEDKIITSDPAQLKKLEEEGNL